MFLASCAISNKDFIYLQGADTVYAVPKEVKEAFELTIQPDDELAISVSSKDPELIEPFNNNVLIGSGARTTSGYSTSTIAATTRSTYFVVDERGNIEFPIFGQINTTGKTCKQLAEELRKRFIEEDYILDAVVNVRIQNFKVVVLGDVKTPGTRTFNTERLSILDALAGAGDLNSTAKRKPILVMRELNGQRITYKVDLCDAENTFNSPAFYLQQNDVVYVQPNKSARIKNSTGYTFITIGSTAASLVVSLASLIIALTD